MTTLDTLKYELAEKEKELSLAELDIFIYNPNIGQLISEIQCIKQQINELEKEEQN